jgi:hypothetical protein
MRWSGWDWRTLVYITSTFNTLPFDDANVMILHQPQPHDLGNSWMSVTSLEDDWAGSLEACAQAQSPETLANRRRAWYFKEESFGKHQLSIALD